MNKKIEVSRKTRTDFNPVGQVAHQDIYILEVHPGGTIGHLELEDLEGIRDVISRVIDVQKGGEG